MFVEKPMKVDALQDEQIVGNSPKIKSIKRAAKKLAKLDSNLLIIGETGVGKEFISRQIHMYSPRRNRPFVELNCSALGKTVRHRELYGEEKAGAEPQLQTIGILEKANRGILFLKNIEDMSDEYQAEFLQILREKRIRRLGGEENIPIDIRIVATSLYNLPKELEARGFRRDLFHLLNTLQLDITPLRERKQDIPELFIYFLRRLCDEQGREVPAVPTEMFESILEYDWKGNVRELENCVQNVLAMSPELQLSTEFLPFRIKHHPLDQLEVKNLKAVINEVETYLIGKALRKFAGNQVKAAKLLGIPEATLRFKIRKYHIPRD
jgi:DNA-binding NtrC family response regulator